MNTYYKLMPNVFLARCNEQHEKGSGILVTTKYGKENECIVFNLFAEKDGVFYYSIVRADGFDHAEWAKKRAERLNNAAAKAEQKSDNYYKASNKDAAFLSLAEPIKIGHHSEKRHRKIIEQAQNNFGKCVEYSDKAENYAERAEYWERKATEINMSMPESIDYYIFKLEKAKERREGLKNGTIQRDHSFSLTYATKEVKDLEAKVKIAHKLWGE